MRDLGRAAIIVFLLFSNAFADDAGWRKWPLAHFTVYTQAPRKPDNFDLNMGRIHQQLRFDLSRFAPWMTEEKVNIYIYRNQKAYADGEFSPPPWSNGLAIYEKRVVLVYQRPGDKKAAEKKMMEVIAHESTHLYFESYWAELGRVPPSWLNEGLAMVEEVGSLGRPEASPRYQAMLDLPGRDIPLADFFGLTPAKDLAEEKDKAEVQRFYAQAYSMVFYLLRQHSTAQFTLFNEKLRGGAAIEEALAEAYKFQSLDKFRAAWLTWLKQPSRRARVSAAIEAESKAEALGPQLPQGFHVKWH